MRPLPTFVLLGMLCSYKCLGAKLLKVPRIYNALITSDEELVPSQAYPAVAPVLRPSPSLYLAPTGYDRSKVEETPLPVPQVPQPLPKVDEIVQWETLKNNKPTNPDIPDVPPPPLPVTFRQSSKP